MLMATARHGDVDDDGDWRYSMSKHGKTLRVNAATIFTSGLLAAVLPACKACQRLSLSSGGIGQPPDEFSFCVSAANIQRTTSVSGFHCSAGNGTFQLTFG